MNDQPILSDQGSRSEPKRVLLFWLNAALLPRLALAAGLLLSANEFVGRVVLPGNVVGALSFAVEALVVALGFWLWGLVAFHHVIFVRFRLAGFPRHSLTPVPVPAWLKGLLAIYVTICVAGVASLLVSQAAQEQLTRTVPRIVACGASAVAVAECWVGYVCGIRLREMRTRLSGI